MRPVLAMLCVAALGVAPACSSDSPQCEGGTEGCTCITGNLCVAGLTCLSNVCVDFEGGEDAKTPDTKGPDAPEPDAPPNDVGPDDVPSGPDASADAEPAVDAPPDSVAEDAAAETVADAGGDEGPGDTLVGPDEGDSEEAPDEGEDTLAEPQEDASIPDAGLDASEETVSDAIPTDEGPADTPEDTGGDDDTPTTSDVAPDVPDTSADTSADTLADTLIDVAMDIPDPDVCTPDCGGAVCGDDGCGGSCGTCPAIVDGSNVCEAGQCVLTCDPGSAEIGGVCDACGGLGDLCCEEETCDANLACNEDGYCACGNQGQPCCGGSECEGGTACNAEGVCSCGGHGEVCCPGETCDEGSACTGSVCSCVVQVGGFNLLTGDGQLWGTSDDPIRYPDGTLVEGITHWGNGCVLTSDGWVGCYASSSLQPQPNNLGQMGDGTTEPRPTSAYKVATPVEGPLGPLADGVFLDGTGKTRCVVRSDTSLWCWGTALNCGGGPGCTDGVGVLFEGTDIAGTNAFAPYAVPVSASEGGPAFDQVEEVRVTDVGICALRTGGTVWCWGLNYTGQAGQGDTNAYYYPALVQGLPSVQHLWSYGQTFCAHGEDGTVWCWGDGSFKQMAVGDTDDQLSPVQALASPGVPLTGVAELRLAKQAAFALMNDGSLWGWGSASAVNSDYPAPFLRDGEPVTNVWTFGPFGSNPGWIDQTTGELLMGATTTYDAPCRSCTPECTLKSCGSDGCGGSCGECGGDTPQCIDGACVPEPCVPDCSDAECGSDGCGGQCGLCPAGSACDQGQCLAATCELACDEGAFLTAAGGVRYRTGEQVFKPTSETLMSDAVGLAAGGQGPACALAEDSTVWCWTRNAGANSNFYGTLGDGTTDPPAEAYVAQQVLTGPDTPLTGVGRIVSDGQDLVCAVKSDETLWCWGGRAWAAPYRMFPNDPACGDYCSAYAVPVPQIDGGPPLMGVVDVAIGGSHACALMGTGTLWCWGDNTFGQLGIGLPVPGLLNPTPITGLGSLIVALDAHQHVTCAVTEETKTWCWGSNDYGELGNGHRLGPAYEPSVVRSSFFGLPALGWTDVAVGNQSVCGLRGEGDMWCWGNAAPNTPDDFDEVPALMVEGVWALGMFNAHPCWVSTAGEAFWQNVFPGNILEFDACAP